MIADNMNTHDLARINNAFLCKELIETVKDMDEFSSESMVLCTAADQIIFDEDTSDEAVIVLERALTVFLDKVFSLYDYNPTSSFLNTLHQRAAGLRRNTIDLLD